MALALSPATVEAAHSRIGPLVAPLTKKARRGFGGPFLLNVPPSIPFRLRCCQLERLSDHRGERCTNALLRFPQCLLSLLRKAFQWVWHTTARKPRYQLQGWFDTRLQFKLAGSTRVALVCRPSRRQRRPCLLREDDVGGARTLEPLSQNCRSAKSPVLVSTSACQLHNRNIGFATKLSCQKCCACQHYNRRHQKKRRN